jgi:hypothetical protein
MIILAEVVIIVCLNIFNRLEMWCYGTMSSQAPDSHFGMHILGMFFMQGQREVGDASLVTGLISVDWMNNRMLK